MTDSVLNVVLGLVATGISAGLGWLAQTVRRRRRLGRIQAFFGMPAGSDCLLVVNRKAGSGGSVSRNDVYALMELSALVKECGARPELVAHDQVRQGLGAKAEFCLGGPASNDRTAAHLRSWLPGVEFALDSDGPPYDLTIRAGEREFAYLHEPGRPGREVFAVLARLRVGPDARPVFLVAGQTAVSNHAAVRYLLANHRALARRYGSDGAFAVVLRVVDSGAYGPDVVDLAADVSDLVAAAPAPVAG
ncbi:hypothetical protein [Kitasatospora terrestris]|uniref:Secreted protein n=1 Tax=Kitasatospora terrestris TaxID=258051 RepID=A0ABP9DQH8_9ACTN